MKFAYISVIILLISKFSLAQNQFWEPNAFSGINVIQVEMDRQNIFYTSVSDTDGYKKLFRSLDGYSWEEKFIPYSGVYQSPLKLLIDTTHSGYDKIYLLKQFLNSTNPDSLFYSTNMGDSWNFIPLPSDLSSYYNIRQMAYNANGDLYIVGDNKIYYTSDEGNIWTLLFDGSLNGWNLTRILIDKQGNFYTNNDTFDPYHGYYEVIYKSTDNGLTWLSDLDSYGRGIQFDIVQTLPSGEMFAGILFGDIYLKKSPNEQWIQINADIDPGSMVITNTKKIYACEYTHVAGINPSKYSPDYGSNWYEFDDGALKIHNLIIDSQGYLYASTQTGLYKSTQTTADIVDRYLINFPATAINDTTSVELSLHNPLTSELIVDSLKFNTQFFCSDFTSPITIAPGDSLAVTIFFMPSSYGNYTDTLNIYSNLLNQNIKVTGDSPYPEMITDPPGFNYWHFPDTIVDSTKLKSISIINHSINFLVIDSIYTHSGRFGVDSFNYPLYLSRDSIQLSISFTPDSSKFFIDTVYIINNIQPPYIIALNGRGKEPVKIESNSEKLKSFILYDNYPNPFNPTTRIKYQIPELSKVKLTVFDMLGRKIQTLVNEEKPAGTYEVEFDGTNLTSGVYFYRMEAGKYSATKKFVLLK